VEHIADPAYMKGKGQNYFETLPQGNTIVVAICSLGAITGRCVGMLLKGVYIDIVGPNVTQ